MLNEFLKALLPHIKFLVPTIAIALVLLFYSTQKCRVRYLDGILMAALIVFASLSAFDWTKRGWLHNDFINSYEFFHYYLPAKYHHELGYTKLYGAAIIAEDELEHQFVPKWSRDLKTGRRINTRIILRKKDEYISAFSSERWEEFKQDVHFFRQDFKSNRGWQKMMNDKGYNGTPIWTLIGGILANSLSTRSKSNINLISFVDWIFFLVLNGDCRCHLADVVCGVAGCTLRC